MFLTKNNNGQRNGPAIESPSLPLQMPQVQTATAGKTARDSLLVAAAESLSLPTGLITAMFLTRTLGPSDYGLFTLTASVISWLQWTVATMFSRPTVKLVSSTEEWQPVAGALLRLQLFTSLSCAAILVLAAGPISEAFREPAMQGYLRLYSLDIILLAAAHGFRSVQIGLGRFRLRAFAAAARWIVRLVLIVVMVAAGWGIEGAIAGNIAASVAELAINGKGLSAALFKRSMLPWGTLLRYATPITLAAICLRLFERLDLTMLKLLGRSAAEVGAYGAAQNLTLPFGIVSMAVSPLLLSSMSQALRKGSAEVASRHAQSGLRVATLCLPFIAIASGAAPELADTIFGRQFRDTGPVLRILVFSAYATIWTSLLQAILIAIDRAVWTAALSACVIPVALLLHWIAIPAYALPGAAVSTTVASTLLAIFSGWLVSKFAGERPPGGTAVRSLLAAIPCCALAYYWQLPASLVTLKLASLSIMAAGLLLALGEFSRAELNAWLPPGLRKAV